MKVYYFGCIKSKGHYFHDADNSYFPSIKIPPGFPWGYSVDGELQPPHPDIRKLNENKYAHLYCGSDFKQGEAIRHVKDGWTCVAYWDRSIDSRPGSCSALICDQVLSTEEIIEAVRKVFPDCIRVEIKEIGNYIHTEADK